MTANHMEPLTSANLLIFSITNPNQSKLTSIQFYVRKWVLRLVHPDKTVTSAIKFTMEKKNNKLTSPISNESDSFKEKIWLLWLFQSTQYRIDREECIMCSGKVLCLKFSYLELEIMFSSCNPKRQFFYLYSATLLMNNQKETKIQICNIHLITWIIYE